MVVESWFKYLNSLSSGLDSAEKNFLKIKKLWNKMACHFHNANGNFSHICNCRGTASRAQNTRDLNTKIITVAGTNGKGSCVAFLEAILLAAGFKVAAFTSPHLLKYNERIRLNGKNISAKKLCEAFAFVEKERGNTILNFFEFTTLAALYIFQQQHFDVILLEVGLGGRYDPVNIVDPDIAIISTISLDHVLQLGNTREAIAAEKAGIMRSHKPIICGDFNPPKTIFSKAKKLNADLYCLNKDFFYHILDGIWSWQFHNKKITALPLPNLPVQNAATVLMAIELLQLFLPINENAIKKGIKKAFLPGRFQQLKNNIILDVAHNPESAELLAENLRKHKYIGKTIAVMSMLKDKDIAKTIKPLISEIDEWYVGILPTKRAATKNQLINAFKTNNIDLAKIKLYAIVNEAFTKALKNKKNTDRIIVFGSFYTVAECLKLLA